MIRVGQHIIHSWFSCGCAIQLKLAFRNVGFHNPATQASWWKTEESSERVQQEKSGNKFDPFMTRGRNRTQATLVRGDCLPICDIPGPFLTHTDTI